MKYLRRADFLKICCLSRNSNLIGASCIDLATLTQGFGRQRDGVRTQQSKCQTQGQE